MWLRKSSCRPIEFEELLIDRVAAQEQANYARYGAD